MGFLNPLALFLGLLGLPIVLLYMLKLRRRDVLVSSTMLWQRLMRDREANAPWQRLRRNLLMLLQLLALALLTLALARPFIPTPTVAGGNVLILLDASASMQADDVSPTRFDAARRLAREIVAGLGAGDTATLIAVGPQPQILASATDDRALLRRALDDALPTDGPADWEAAGALATGQPGGDLKTVIISDGALPESLPALPGEVHLLTVGGGSDNRAITALTVRDGPDGVQAFVRLVNNGDAPVAPLVEFHADDTLFDARRVPLPPHSGVGLTLDDLPYDLHVLRAAFSTPDALPLDDTAWAVHGGTTSRRVLLLSPGNLFLERALGLLPEIDLTRIPISQQPPTEGYDLYVYDGPVTGTLPAGNLWLIGPAAVADWGGAGTVFTATAPVEVADDPLLRYVDWDTVHILRAYDLPRPPGARVLVRAAGGPLLFVAERPEGRLAVLTFDLRESDLPLQISFPVLTVNLLDWLLPSEGGLEAALAHPGDPVPLQPAPSADEIAVTAPDGERYILPVGEQVPVFAATDRVGLYRVEHLSGGGEVLRSGLLAVNLFDEAESDIAPRAAVRVGQRDVTGGPPETVGRRELWPWLAGAALAVLAVEWWLYFVGQGGNRA